VQLQSHDGPIPHCCDRCNWRRGVGDRPRPNGSPLPLRDSRRGRCGPNLVVRASCGRLRSAWASSLPPTLLGASLAASSLSFCSPSRRLTVSPEPPPGPAAGVPPRGFLLRPRQPARNEWLCWEERCVHQVGHNAPLSEIYRAYMLHSCCTRE